MKRGFVLPLLLSLGALMLSACREDETLAAAVAAAATANTNGARSGTSSTGSTGGSTGGSTVSTGSGTSGGTSTSAGPGSSSGGSGGGASGPADGGTTASTEAVTVIHSAGATLYVRRGNEEVWIFDLGGNPNAAVGDSFEYRSLGGAFGGQGSVLVEASGGGASYRVVAARRFR